MVAIYNLTIKSYIWWQDIERERNKIQYLTLKTFKNNFRQKYFSEQYYEENDMEFYKRRL